MFPADRLPIFLTNRNNNIESNSTCDISQWTAYHQLSAVPMSIQVTEAVSSHFKQMWYITCEVDVMSSSEWVLYLRNYISTHFFKFTQHIKSSIRCCSITCNSDTIKSMQFKSMTSRMIGQIFSPLRCVVRYCTTEMKRMV